MHRRDFLKYSIVSSTALLYTPTYAQVTSLLSTHIVICGAGYAGLSVAKYLKEFNPTLRITLIEKNKQFVSCPFSNAYLGEVHDISFDDLTFDYKKTAKKFGYGFVNEEVIKISRHKKEVSTATQTLSYDFLVLCGGIEYNYEALNLNATLIEELKQKAPAGLKPPLEHLQLKKMIEEFKGGNFIITVPNGNYKCPPAPYERACMIAHYFKTHQIKGKVIILDPREKPAAKSKAFLEVFDSLYKDYIEFQGLSNFKTIDFSTKKITVEAFDKEALEYKEKIISFESANIIPPNKANGLIALASLELTLEGWAKLKEPTFQSSLDKHVYILGDAQGQYPFPKSAQMANSSALQVALEINHALVHKTFDYTNNTLGNICYSFVSDTKAVAITHTFTYEPAIKTSAMISNIDEGTALSAKNWYESLTSTILA
jgi:sulfide dehydrogenase [flavocytochrome c] flavoprotein chain